MLSRFRFFDEDYSAGNRTNRPMDRFGVFASISSQFQLLHRGHQPC